MSAERQPKSSQPGSQTGAMFLFCPILDSFVCLYNFFTNKNI